MLILCDNKWHFKYSVPNYIFNFLGISIMSYLFWISTVLFMVLSYKRYSNSWKIVKVHSFSWKQAFILLKKKPIYWEYGLFKILSVFAIPQIWHIFIFIHSLKEHLFNGKENTKKGMVIPLRCGTGQPEEASLQE